jgi:hypothetical protein
LLESQHAKGAHPVANFFGNWVAHALLDRNKTGFEILQEINAEIIAMLAGEGSSGPFGQVMTSTFKFDTLRSDLLGVCKSFGVCLQAPSQKITCGPESEAGCSAPSPSIRARARNTEPWSFR